MKQSNSETMKKGFTLLEVIVAVSLIVVGVIGVFGLLYIVLVSGQVSSSQLVAAYLAQEGIEIVRNIRDTNWLKNNPWDEGITAGDWEADYTTNNLTDTYDGDYLRIDINGFYNYSAGTSTKFKRRITIFGKTDLSFPPDDTYDMFKVRVTVEWQERGRTHQISAQENLYNWYY